MQLKLEEYSDSSWNLARKSCLKVSKVARFNGSEGFKPRQCFLTTWSHVYHAGLAPSQIRAVVCNRLPIAAEWAFLPSPSCFVFFLQIQLGTAKIDLAHCFFTPVTKSFLMLVHRSAWCNDRRVTLGNKDMSNTELCSPGLRTSGSNKASKCKTWLFHFPFYLIRDNGKCSKGPLMHT